MTVTTADVSIEGARPDRPSAGRAPWRTAARQALTIALLVGAAWAAYDHRAQISQAGTMLSHLHAWWLVVAVAAEIASMVVFARLQRWLLLAGGVDVGLVSMIEIVLAGNALSSSLPGGPAWSATWAYGQLRRRGANRLLAGWVIVVAGVLAGFAVFVIVVTGSWVAGSTGPLASLRWLAAALAAVPPAAAAGIYAARRYPPLRFQLARAWQAISVRFGPAQAVGAFTRRTVDSLGLVRPSLLGWAEAFVLAMANWIYDAACLVACIAALGIPVPWRGILVIYGLTQVSACLPITPGGLGVVEGSLAALLVAYGVHADSALAVVLLYRIVSFWALVPVGWGAWFGLELAQRRGLRPRAHPWAVHDHGPEPAPALASVGPERILRPDPCAGCD
jgi:uncharacterized membrane protein YbhN (UPF0104 family)